MVLVYMSEWAGLFARDVGRPIAGGADAKAYARFGSREESPGRARCLGAGQSDRAGKSEAEGSRKGGRPAESRAARGPRRSGPSRLSKNVVGAAR